MKLTPSVKIGVFFAFIVLPLLGALVDGMAISP